MAYVPLASLLLSCALLAVSSRAYAIGEETIASEAFNTVVGGALTTQMKNNDVVWDLAGRYYEADPSLQDDSPLVNSVNGKTLHDYTQIQWQVEAAGQGVLNWYMVHPETGEKIPASSPLFQSVYEDWYNYYEGITEGGGSSGVGGSLTNPINLTGLFGKYPPASANGLDLAGVAGSINISSSTLDNINNASNGKYVLFAVYNTQYGTYKDVIYSDNPINVSYTLVDGTTTLWNVTISGNGLYSIQLIGSVNQNSNGVLSGSNLYSNQSSGVFHGNSISGGNYNYVRWLYMSEGVNSSPAPTEPVYPPAYEPYTPTQPTSPTNNNPTNVNIGGNTYNNNTGTTSVDLTPLLEMLRIINNNIIELETGFNNYANKVQEYLSNMYDMVYGFLLNIQDEIDDYGRLILEELREANQWLAYIFYSLGQGGGSQPDPVVKPDDWWGWLGNLVDGLLGDLPTELTALTGTMQALRKVFPFSLPWDLGVLLGLFVATPVTPVLDIPFGYSANGITYIHVDFSAWNNVMATVRSVELVAFAAGLAFKTRDLLKVVEV